MRPKPPKSWKGSDGNDKHNRCGDGCQETMEATCTMKQATSWMAATMQIRSVSFQQLSNE